VAFPNDFKPADKAADLFARYGETTKEALEAEPVRASVAGRMMLKRVMGKASFATLQDASFGPSGGRIQIYLNNDGVGEAQHSAFKHWDLGDIIAVEGVLMRTRTGELTIQADRIRLITKSLRPLPDKFHGIADQEIKYRQRYVDLMTDETARKRFVARSQALASIRDFMVSHGFLEVETPMLHPIPGGANAKPFKTHHNALDQEMFLRIAPELYLKRLLVGGFDRVFEINRNFRNEGISVRHNPEFTMMEFYAAYWNYQDLMDFNEQLIRHVVRQVRGDEPLTYQGQPVDILSPFERLTIREAIVKYTEAGDSVDDAAWLQAQLKKLGLSEEKHQLSGRSLPACRCCTLKRRSRTSSGTRPSSWTTRRRSRRWRAPTTRTLPSPSASSSTSPGASSAMPSRNSTTPRTRPRASRRRPRPRTGVTKRPCTTTPTTSVRWSTACRPPAVVASASTA
jgi:lysyl-tRNA synthetase class 2